MDDQIDREAAARLQQFAHDLLQPVAIIQAVVSSLRASAPNPARLREDLALIETELRVMAELCQTELDAGRPVAPVDLTGIIGRVVERMRLGYEGDIEAEVGDPIPWSLPADPVDWERCIVNLVENACRAAGRGGKVVVALDGDDDALCVSVGDSGPGFGASATGRSSLGLAAVSRLVDHHAGHLELRRSPLGGAQITVVIPRPQPAPR